MTHRIPIITVLAVMIAAALLVGDARPAQAHAILVRSDPAVNAQLKVAPQQVVAFYSEPLDQRLSTMEVRDGTGDLVETGDVTFGPAPEQMGLTIETDLEPGFYTVVWETLSTVDGHLFKGSFPFTVLNPDGSQPSGPRYEASGGGAASTSLPNIITKWIQLLAGVLLVGTLAFVVLVNRPATASAEEPERRASRTRALRDMRLLAWPAVTALALTGGMELLLQADQLGGFGYLDEVLDTDWGQRWMQRGFVLAAVVAALVIERINARRDALSAGAAWAALAGGVVYLLLVALVSHGNAVPGSFWAVGADFLHLVASAVWVGMLAMLLLLLLHLRRREALASTPGLVLGHLARFSVFAATSVIVLLGSGVINGLTQIPDVSELTETAYGRALLVKLAIMLLLLIVAGLNAFYLRARFAEETENAGTDDVPRRRLAVAVRIELALAVAVLLAAAVMILHPTARQLDQAAAASPDTQAVVGYEEIQPAGDVVINLTVSPNVAGQNSFRVFLFPQAGGDLGEVLRVRLRFVPPGEDAAPSELVMEPAGPNAYRAVGPFLVTDGDWNIHVDVRRAEVDDVSATFPVPVAASDLVGGGQFSFPLATGTWMTLIAVIIVVLSLVAAVWLAGWPAFQEWAPRALRVGTAAFTVVGLGLFTLSILPQPEQDASANPIDATAESIAIGRSLYMQNCATCHGETGRGDGPQAETLPVPPADFRVHVPYHQDEFFFNVIGNGLGEIMPSFGEQLTEEERWHIVNFLKSEFGSGAEQTSNR
jgi:copper transport protein